MKFHRTRIATAVSLSLFGTLLAAQTTAQDPQLGTVVVTGIRASIEKSIAAKRDADTNVEVVSAEDVGKMPDKNIADALSRLPGVNVQFGGALAMDEAERVAIRGTSPNLNLVTVNGHALSSGDWHVGDQGSSGRSVGFGLMPSQLIGQSFVYKNGRSDITEGGIAGTVDIQTRKPLSFKKGITGEVAVGAVHATLPATTDPQLSGLLAWKSDDGNYGFLLQAFQENRHLRRDGQETFSFGVVTQAQANASGNPELAGKRMPGSLNSAFFEGARERQGGFIALQAKPTKDLEVIFSAFRADLKADNYNSSAFALPTGLLGQGWLIRDAAVRGDVIVKATLVRPPETAANANQRVVGLQFDHNLREGAKSLSSFYDLGAKLRITDALTVRGTVGFTEGSGVTNSQPSQTFGLINPNMSYTINGTRPTDYALFNKSGNPIDTGNIAQYVQLSNTGASVMSADSERYLHLDGDYKLGGSAFTNLKFGMRRANHTRTYDVVAPRWNAQDTAAGLPVTPSPFISVTGGALVNGSALPVYPGTVVPTTPSIVPTMATPATAYPANFANGLDANFPRNLFRFDPAQLQTLANQYVKWDSVTGKTWTSGYEVKEANDAYYFMGEFEATDALTGNVGLRWASTALDSLSYQALPNGTAAGQCVPTLPCSIPGAIVGSRFATYLPQLVSTTTNTLLPSLNLRWTLAKDLIARAGVGRSMGRANYNELAGAVSLNNTLLTGTSGNALLNPVTSNNLDLSLAWYFAPRAYMSGGVFAQSLNDYVKNGLVDIPFFNTSTGSVSTYAITTKRGTTANLKGVEGAIELPIGSGFGVNANALYAQSEDAEGVEMLGTSKWTVNLRGFYEDNKLSASLAYNYRTDYSIGYSGNGTKSVITNAAGVVTGYNGLHYYKGSGSLSASVGYKINRNVSVHLDGTNLTDPVRSTYFINEDAPGYWHQSGRQFFVNLRAKF